jgi:putative flippase GtrA
MNSPQSGQSLQKQGIRFIIFGAFNTLVTYFAYCLLVYVMHPQVAYAIVFALGIGLAYVGNSRFVFRESLEWKVARVYPLVYLMQYALTASLIHAFELLVGMGPRLALALALVVSTPASFFLNRFMLSRAQHGGGTQ